MQLIEQLIRIQKAEHLSDAKFATKLKSHRATWIRIRTQKTGISTRFLQNVIAVYPGLKKEVDIILNSNATPCNY